MAKEVLKFFEGHCIVNDKPESFSVTYVERENGLFERRDLRDCRYKGLFNPRGCVDCELITHVKPVIDPHEIDPSDVVEEFQMRTD